MDATDWFRGNDIHNMLQFARPSERKIRLFAIACYKHAIKDRSSEWKLAENFVDGKTHKNVLHIAYQSLDNLWGRQRPEFCLLFTVTNLDRIVKIVSHGTKIMATIKHSQDRETGRQVERKWQASLLRHMVKINW